MSPSVFRLVAFGLAGLIFGSFLTVLVHRLPRREGVAGGRSRCPRCGTQIRAVDNIPVVSYLMLRGRCRACGARISPVYPLVELATAILFVLAAATFADLFVAILLAPFLGLMLAVALIDARWRIVPNRIVYPALLAYLLAIVGGDLAGRGVDAVSALIGLAAYAAPLFLVALVVPGGMGLGDVKLVALIGLVLGGLGLRYVAVAAASGILMGGLGAILAIVIFRYGRRQHIPFGPFLAGGAVVAAFFGPALADAYLSLTGLS